jgi:hypothetical protein
MTRLLLPLEVGHDGGKVGLKIARALKRIQDRTIVGAAVADLLHAPPLDLARDEATEGFANTLGVR